MITINRNLVFSAFTLIALIGIGPSVIAQQSTTFKVAGPCAKCGVERLVKFVESLDGVNTAKYDARNFQLSVDFDPTVASALDMQLELSGKGYDAGDFSHDPLVKLPACAMNTASRGEMEELGLNDLEDVEDPANWDSAQNLDELEKLGRKGDDDSVISTDFLLTEDVEDDDGEELMNWEPVQFDDTDDGNP